MKANALWDYIYFGTCLRYLQDSQPEDTVHGKGKTNLLRTKTRGRRPDPLILDHLDHIRRSFRNPTQHPDKIYDIQEAQDLFGLCVDAVNRMSRSVT